MRSRVWFTFMSACLIVFAEVLPCHGQGTATPTQQPSRGAISDGGRGDEMASPVVAADGHITFRVKAPQASSVSVTSDFQGETPMLKSPDGVWSVTVGPIEPDVYYYNFIVDGVRTVDPGNSSSKIGYYTSTNTSVLKVPASEPAFCDVKDVPHGELRTHIYKSNSNEVIRELNVYVPPGYDDNTVDRYPVLYLLHGNANDHHSWQRYGRANEILDNLLAERAIKPMLVVMPLGYGRASIDGDGHGIAAKSGPNNRWAGPSVALGPGVPDFYERDILEDVVPMIERKYRVIADRRSRAIFGFSMGGGQAGRIGLRHLDIFSNVGVMSAGAGRPGEAGLVSLLAANVEDTNKKIDLLWIGCGRDDFAFTGASSFAKELKEAGIKHTFVESSGGHHWRVWRRYFHEVLPKLFLDESATASLKGQDVAGTDRYEIGPDSIPQPGVPKGKLTQSSITSKVFDGREFRYQLYVPQQYDSAKAACVMVFQDGNNYVREPGAWHIPVVFDNLIAKGEMPVTIGIFLDPSSQRTRADEYDTLSDRYARFVIDEVLPEVAQSYNLTQDPNGRAIAGFSSGAIGAFTVAWERSDSFRKVVSCFGSFTSIGYRPATASSPMRIGGDMYPTLIRRSPIKPIKVFFQDGSNDLNNQFGSWWLANQQMVSAMEWANGNARNRADFQYKLKFEWGDGGHTAKHGASIFPNILRWLWSDQIPKS